MLEVSFTGFGKCWYVYISGVHVHKQNIIKWGDKKVTGIFSLSDEDEKEYIRTNGFYHVKKMKPLPSPGSTFSKLLEEGRIQEIDAEYCIFEVMQSRRLKNPIRGNVEIDPGNIFEPVFPDIKQDQSMINEPVLPIDQTDKSTELRQLNFASNHFWYNGKVDRDDKTTWPDTKEIEEHFMKIGGHGRTRAEYKASIIRPDWAEGGNRPKK